MSRRAGRRTLAWLLVVGALVVEHAPPAAAVNINAVWPELGLPGFRIVPLITERAEYHSNILQQPRNELDDFISRTMPGVLVELPFRGHRLDLTARGEIVRYLNHPQFDTEHFYL